MTGRLIYALVDPRAGQIRYVGLSLRGMDRPRVHLRRPLDRDRTHRANLLRHWSSLGVVPEIQVLDSGFLTDEEASQAERYWISLLRIAGCDLVNHTDGGIRGRPDAATRKKIGDSNRGKTRTDESRARIKISKMGEKNPSYGVRQDPAKVAARTCVGERNGMWGRQPAPETAATRFKPGHNLGGTWTVEQRTKLSGDNHWRRRNKEVAAGHAKVPAACKIRARPVCSSCKQPGHYRTTCPNPCP